MVLQGSGRITLNQIAGEFGGSTPHKLSEYYAAAVGVPGSGTIRLSNFYGKSNNPDPPTWTTGTNMGLVASSTSFSFSVSAYSDSAVTLSMISSPFGSFSSNAGNGTVSGTTPNVNKTTYSWTIRATDQEGQTTDRTFSMVVSKAPTWLTGSFLGSFRSGYYHTVQVSATSDSTVTYGFVNAPSGTSLFTASGSLNFDYINWPLPVGTQYYTLTATDQENQVTSKTFSVTVLAPIAPSWLTNAYNANYPYNGYYIDVGTWSYGSYFYVNFTSYVSGSQPYYFSQSGLSAFSLDSFGNVQGSINFGPGAAYWFLYVSNSVGNGGWVTVGMNVI